MRNKNNKKRVSFLIVGAIILLTVVIIGKKIWIEKPLTPVRLSSEVEGKAKELDNITIDAVFHPNKKQLEVKQRMTLKNPGKDGLEELVLRTYANAFYLQETSPAAIEEFFELCYYKGFVLRTKEKR